MLPILNIVESLSDPESQIGDRGDDHDCAGVSKSMNYRDLQLHRACTAKNMGRSRQNACSFDHLYHPCVGSVVEFVVNLKCLAKAFLMRAGRSCQT